jgi:hypothetical protein
VIKISMMIISKASNKRSPINVQILLQKTKMINVISMNKLEQRLKDGECGRERDSW